MIEQIRMPIEISSNVSKEERVEWLMNEYGENIARLAFTYMKNEQLSEDIAQEVFLKCYEHLDNFRNESSYKRWLYHLAIFTFRENISNVNFLIRIVVIYFNRKIDSYIGCHTHFA